MRPAKYRSAGILTGLFALLVVFTSAAPRAAQPAFDWHRFAGTTISVSLKKVPWTDSLTPKIPEFEKLTGITVKLEVLPEDQQRAKLNIALSSGGAGVDVYDTQRHNEGLAYAAAGWYEPVAKYLANPALTPANFGYPDDFLQSAINDSTIHGVLTALPIYTETTILAYRKDLFSAAGLKPPDTLDDLENAARKLTDKSKGQYGICLRGLGPAASGIVGSFFYSTGGSWIDDKNNPAIASPASVKGFELYGQLDRDFGPPGVLNYHWFQCQSLFAAGRVAMWIDANSVMNPLLDPSKSEVADKTAFAMMPAGAGGRQPGFGTHGLAIFPGSKNKGAAWFFIEWAMSRENALRAQLIGVPSARKSPWANPEVQKNQRYAQLRAVTLETMQLPHLSPFSPPWVAVSQIRDIVGSAIDTAIRGGNVKAALEAAVQQIQAVRRQTEKGVE